MTGSAPITWLDRVESTQDAAHELAANGAPHGAAVAAAEQTHGRGSRGRGWLSPRGGLWLSVVCRPVSASAPQVLSIRAALAVATAVSRGGTAPIGIKWPNDLILDNRKVGGVLSEARWVGDSLAWIVVGVGLNVQNPIPAELRSSAVSLAELGDRRSVAELAGPVATAVAGASARIGALEPDEEAAVALRDWLRGQALSAPVAGVAAGIAADGALRVTAAERMQIVRNGPVIIAPSTLHA